MAANPKFEIFKGADGDFYFRLRAENGEIVLASEGYTTKASCKNGIKSVMKNAANDLRYLRHDGHFYFVLRAGNNEVIGVSEMYRGVTSRETGIEAVKDDGPTAPIVDTT